MTAMAQASQAELRATEEGRTGSFVADWNAWHEGRVANVTAPYGPASLTLTLWLREAAEVSVPGLQGLWSLRGETIVGAEPSVDGGIELTAEAPDARLGNLLLRRFDRDGKLALRVLDPDAPGRVALEGIDAFEPDPAYRLPARFELAPAQREITLADGYVSQKQVSGVLVFTLDGEERRLTATLGPNGISVVFGDETNGESTYGFRFLSVDLPDERGDTVIDFNRAYLPPCAFSDQFVCPLPTPENRLRVAVPTGERLARRRQGAR